MHRIMLRALIIFTLFIYVSSSYSQNTSWLMGSWKGKSYLPGSDAAQYFALTLRVSSIKGNKFEGTISTMEPADTAIRYDAKLNGEIFDGYITINPTKIFYVRNSPGSRWQLSCINCKSAKYFYSLQDEKFSIKGAIDECYRECNGISEFVKELNEMSVTDQDSVYALLHMKKPQAVATTATEQINPVPAAITTQSLLDNTLRTLLLPVGDVVAVKNKNSFSLKERTNAIVKRNASLTIKENALLRRIPILPAGNIIDVKDANKDLLASQDLIQSLRRGRPLLPIYQSTPSITVTHKIPVSIDSIASTVKDKIVATAVNQPVLLKDTASRLPVGYKERKVSVVRTLPVATDSVVIRVYDNGVVDGDIVSVVYNDKTVIDKLSLTTKAFTITIPVNKDAINTLVFHAQNLGEFPPNTARLEIISGNKKEELTISSDYTVSSSVNIVYKP